MQLGIPQFWVWMQGLLFAVFVTVSKSVNLAQISFTHLQNEAIRRSWKDQMRSCLCVRSALRAEPTPELFLPHLSVLFSPTQRSYCIPFFFHFTAHRFHFHFLSPNSYQLIFPSMTPKHGSRWWGGALDMPPSASQRAGRKNCMVCYVWCPGSNKTQAGYFPKQDCGIFQKHWIYFQQALTGSFLWKGGLSLPPPSPGNLCSQLAAFLYTVRGSCNKTWPFAFFSPSIDHCSEFSIPALSCYDLFLK